MDGQVSVSIGLLVSILGFLLQVGLTVGAVAWSHGSLNQRVVFLEERIKEHATLSTAVAKLETEIESIGREIKNLRDDFRRILDEFANRPRARA